MENPRYETSIDFQTSELENKGVTDPMDESIGNIATFYQYQGLEVQ